MDNPLNDEVKCYSGSSFAERPLSFVFQGRDYTVDKILSTALTPERKKFIIRTKSLEIFRLERILNNDQWLISFLSKPD